MLRSQLAVLYSLHKANKNSFKIKGKKTPPSTFYSSRVVCMKAKQ